MSMQKRIQWCLVPLFLFSTMSLAEIKPMVAISVGADYANIDKSNTNITFLPPFYNSYIGTNSQDTEAFGGIFLGAEFNVNSQWLSQLGISYYQNNSFQTRGDVYQLGLPAFNNFTYKYNVTSRRVLLETKWLYTFKKMFHPYIDVGVGEAFNRASGYTESPDSSDAVPMSQPFGSHSTSQFAYLAGFGIDMDIDKQLRLGLGYRYANLGKASLGTSPLQTGTTTLSNNSIHSNELIFQLTAFC